MPAFTAHLLYKGRLDKGELSSKDTSKGGKTQEIRHFHSRGPEIPREPDWSASSAGSAGATCLRGGGSEGGACAPPSECLPHLAHRAQELLVGLGQLEL